VRGAFFRPGPTPSKPWYERSNGARYHSDHALVAESYPLLRFHIEQSAHRVVLEGSIVIKAECGIPIDVATLVKFPWDYPEWEPVAYDAARRFKARPGKLLVDRHICPDGQCCLWLQPRTKWDSQDPSALGAFLDELTVFFHRQLIYDITGSWPGPEYDHGTNGYVQFIREQLADDEALAASLLPVITMQEAVGRNDLCPCGAGKKFKRCHLEVVGTIQRLVRIDKIKQLFAGTGLHSSIALRRNG
jgi:hypothetical protein